MLRAGKAGLRARDEADVAVLHAELYEDIAARARADSRPWLPIPPGPASPYAVTGPRDDLACFSVVELDSGELAGEALLWAIDLHNRLARVAAEPDQGGDTEEDQRRLRGAAAPGRQAQVGQDYRHPDHQRPSAVPPAPVTGVRVDRPETRQPRQTRTVTDSVAGLCRPVPGHPPRRPGWGASCQPGMSAPGGRDLARCRPSCGRAAALA